MIAMLNPRIRGLADPNPKPRDGAVQFASALADRLDVLTRPTTMPTTSDRASERPSVGRTPYDLD